MNRAWKLPWIALLTASLILTAGCGNEDKQGHLHHGANGEKMETVPVREMPSFLGNYTDATQNLYTQVQNAADIMKEVKCYCGCMDYADDPHDSLYRCYVVEHTGDEVTWTNHGAECGICLDELRDILQLKQQGKSDEEIKQFIEDKYNPAL
jgi:hypothetical protein